jgi:hypothetical protein
VNSRFGWDEAQSKPAPFEEPDSKGMRHPISLNTLICRPPAKSHKRKKRPKTQVSNTETWGTQLLPNFDLGHPPTSKNLSVDLSLSDVVFTHCAVFYNGGPLVVVPVKMAAGSPARLVGTLSFSDCLFIVSLPTVPSAYGKELAVQLLTAPNAELKLNWVS